MPSGAHTNATPFMNRAFSAPCVLRHEPRALPWAGMKDAFGVTCGVLFSLPGIDPYVPGGHAEPGEGGGESFKHDRRAGQIENRAGILKPILRGKVCGKHALPRLQTPSEIIFWHKRTPFQA